MPRRRKNKVKNTHVIAPHIAQPKPPTHFFENIATRWSSLTTQQRLTLLICMLLLTGLLTAGIGYFILRPTRQGNSTSREKATLTPIPSTSFWSHSTTLIPSSSPSHINSILEEAATTSPLLWNPLRSTPTRLPHLPALETIQIDNLAKEGTWQHSLRFTYHSVLYKGDKKLGISATFTQEILNEKLFRLQKALESLLLSALEQAAVSNIELCIVDRDIIYGADAMVDARSGTVFFASDLPSNQYENAFKNELIHLKTRYYNFLKYGIENLPKASIEIFCPFIKLVNQQWTIDLVKQQELKQALEQGEKRLIAAIKYIFNSEVSPGYTQNVLENFQNKIRDSVPKGQNMENFLYAILGRLGVMQEYYAKRGEARYTLEFHSELGELPEELQKIFFPEVLKYEEEYYQPLPQVSPLKSMR